MCPRKIMDKRNSLRLFKCIFQNSGFFKTLIPSEHFDNKLFPFPTFCYEIDNFVNICRRRKRRTKMIRLLSSVRRTSPSYLPRQCSRPLPPSSPTWAVPPSSARSLSSSQRTRWVGHTYRHTVWRIRITLMRIRI